MASRRPFGSWRRWPTNDFRHLAWRFRNWSGVRRSGLKLSNAVLYVLPTVFSGALAFLTLLLYTLRLGPEDYGLFALLISIASLVSFLPGALSGYLFPTYFN